MKVLYDTTMLYIDSVYKGGIYYFTLNLLRHLRKLKNIKVVEYPLGIEGSLIGYIKSLTSSICNRKALKAFKYVDLIYVPHPRLLTHTCLPLLAKIVDKPVNMTIHDVHFLITPQPLIYKVKLIPRYFGFAHIMELLDNIFITTVSEFSKYAICEYLRIPPNRVEVIYPGVDEIFRPLPMEKAREHVRRVYGLTDYVLYVGAIHPSKGVLRTLKAFSIARKYGLNYKLVLAGPVGMHIDILYKYAKYLRVREDVIYLGYVPRTDLPYLMRAAKVFIFLSIHEGLGLPVVEAMACGTPVIVSNIPPLCEVVRDSAALVNPHDFERIAQVLVEICTDTKLREELSHKALLRARDFTWDNAVSKYLTFWARVTGVSV